MNIIKNMLSDQESNMIESTFRHSTFPWFLVEKAVDAKILDGFVSASVFRHFFIYDGDVNSEWAYIINPLLDKLRFVFDKEIFFCRAIANCVTINTELIGKNVCPHVDIEYENPTYDDYDTYTGVFYVNSCDGDTIFYDKQYSKEFNFEKNLFHEVERITPVKNTFAYWDSRTYHSAPASGSTIRFVININFYIKQ